MLMLQAATAGELGNAWDMIRMGTPLTKLIIFVCVLFSVGSWVLIVWKWIQFRRLRREADRFVEHVSAATRLDDAYQSVLNLPDSPFTRVFRRGVTFFGELRPGAARAGSDVRGLSPAQLEVLKLVLAKEEGEERDLVSHGLNWLAMIATVGPLLGLLGTVLGVMNSFVGVAQSGSSSIAAVAPGVAEALVTTVAGLIVAIPAAMGYNYFVSRLNFFAGELEGFSSELIGSLAREGRI